MSKGIPTRKQVRDYASAHGLKVEIKMSKDLYGNTRMTVVFDHGSSNDGLANFRIRQDMAHALAINHGVLYGSYSSIQFYKRRKGT